MKAAACGTWLGDLISALIVTDMMLQDDLYPEWAPRVRRVRSHVSLMSEQFLRLFSCLLHPVAGLAWNQYSDRSLLAGLNTHDLNGHHGYSHRLDHLGQAKQRLCRFYGYIYHISEPSSCFHFKRLKNFKLFFRAFPRISVFFRFGDGPDYPHARLGLSPLHQHPRC